LPMQQVQQVHQPLQMLVALRLTLGQEAGV
jgi:hypothetical protein